VSELRITTAGGAITFPVRAAPRAKRNAVAGVTGDALKICVTAPPEDGRANDALIEVLADWLAVKRRQVEIISGAANRNKVVRITGVTAEQLLAKI
jgi:uncharacterized protein (TIGR00251 family)